MNGAVRKMIMAAAAAVFLFSGVVVLGYRLQMRAGVEYADVIAQAAVVLSTERPDGTSAEESPDKSVDCAPIQVDFDLLRAQNQDVVAWIYCPDTPINYPVAQAPDNEYYLRRLLDGSSNSSGTLFMDFRNSADLSDWNSIIYGHNMQNDAMFGTLPDYEMQAYFESHPVMFLLTPEQDYRINVMAGFVTPAGAELYRTFNPAEKERLRLMEEWRDASDFDAGIVSGSENRMITLSTCSYEYRRARYVVIGVLEAISNS